MRSSGAIRGILELVILQKLLDEVGFDLPIQELFDLAIGTSTGRLKYSFLQQIDCSLICHLRGYSRAGLVQDGLVGSECNSQIRTIERSSILKV